MPEVLYRLAIFWLNFTSHVIRVAKNERLCYNLYIKIICMINNFVSHNDDEIEEPEELSDDDATLADDLLDEVAGVEVEEEDEALEGFGILPIKEDDDDEEEKEENEDEDAELEDDAEDVEFDAFDDIDEL